jgi:hypothetical protein
LHPRILGFRVTPKVLVRIEAHLLHP